MQIDNIYLYSLQNRGLLYAHITTKQLLQDGYNIIIRTINKHSLACQPPSPDTKNEKLMKLHSYNCVFILLIIIIRSHAMHSWKFSATPRTLNFTSVQNILPAKTKKG